MQTLFYIFAICFAGLLLFVTVDRLEDNRNDVISKYCSCYMNTLADTITYGDRNAIVKDGIGVLQKEVGAANASCIDKMRRSLLGGR